MAIKLDSSAQHMSNMETGKYFPTIDTLFEIGEVTGKEVIIMFR
jgi:DNA-binding XRE family transcriptional regulator